MTSSAVALESYRQQTTPKPPHVTPTCGPTGQTYDASGMPVNRTPQQQKCVEDHQKAAAAIGTNALENASKAFNSGVPGLDWAGGFSASQIIKSVLSGAPIKAGAVVESAGYGLLAKAAWGTLKSSSIAMYGMMKAAITDSAFSCFQ